MARDIALIRAVGGATAMKMAELRAALSDAGLVDVSTLQVAGNVVFDATASGSSDPGQLVRRTVLERFGHDLAVIVRSRDELVEAMDRHPYVESAPSSKVSIAFLAEAPTPELTAAVDHDRSPGDSFAVDGREIFLCHPNGIGTSKLTLGWLERQLRVTGTARNINTVAKLIAMAGTD